MCVRRSAEYADVTRVIRDTWEDAREFVCGCDVMGCASSALIVWMRHHLHRLDALAVVGVSRLRLTAVASATASAEHVMWEEKMQA